MMKQRFGSKWILLLGLLGSSWTAPAFGTEVYSWTDENGVVHFSDSPDPSRDMEIIEVEEIYSPGTTGAYSSPDQADTPPAADSPDAPGEAPVSPAQQKREEMALERAEREELQAQTDRLCALHRQRLEQMEPARRVFYTNEQGESIRMDDDQRVGLIDESRAFLAENCE
jgi:hypothetical protein